MKWLDIKENTPRKYEVMLILLAGGDVSLAYYGRGRLGEKMKDIDMWRGYVDRCIYPDFLITHFMYIPKLNKN